MGKIRSTVGHIFTIVLNALVAIMPDVIILAGAFCITTGAAIIHPAVGWIVGGVLLVLVGFLAGRGITVLLRGGRSR